ncbi:hypothetical protein, partial [Halosimplex marinum]|uniref:hypothetical protein n=1 Tax=Halosimplex marinum TaxID=3396620 RepID=UPI003F55D7C3
MHHTHQHDSDRQTHDRQQRRGEHRRGAENADQYRQTGQPTETGGGSQGTRQHRQGGNRQQAGGQQREQVGRHFGGGDAQRVDWGATDRERRADRDRRQRSTSRTQHPQGGAESDYVQPPQRERSEHQRERGAMSPERRPRAGGQPQGGQQSRQHTGQQSRQHSG